MKKNIWLDGMLGLAVGDALGCPVQFMTREEICSRGKVTGMEGYGTYNMPPGTWTDDTSMALAIFDSIAKNNGIDPGDIMRNFVDWEFCGAYTPFGEAFDEGNTCSSAIWKYHEDGDWKHCGRTGEHANGNGALMRVLPVCLFYLDEERFGKVSDEEAIEGIHQVSALTHNHIRSHMACGIYYFMAKEIVKNREEKTEALADCLQQGLHAGMNFYLNKKESRAERDHFQRLTSMEEFREVPEELIKSSGYVIDSLEASVWCLLRTDTFEKCLLKAVNLGDDSDTVGAIAGGLAGLYYGYEAIPGEWLEVLQDMTVQDGTVKLADYILAKG